MERKREDLTERTRGNLKGGKKDGIVVVVVTDFWPMFGGGLVLSRKTCDGQIVRLRY